MEIERARLKKVQVYFDSKLGYSLHGLMTMFWGFIKSMEIERARLKKVQVYFDSKLSYSLHSLMTMFGW